VEWLKVWALSSNPTTKKKKKENGEKTSKKILKTGMIVHIYNPSTQEAEDHKFNDRLG
jgi:threonine/homoserine/homoserine lactone efflux protein